MKKQEVTEHTVTGKKIIFHDGKVVDFEFPIAKTVACGECLVVLLDVPIGMKFNENVSGIDCNGRVLWQIEKKKYVYEDSPYTEISQKEGNIVLYNWDGLEIVVDPKTGRIVEEKYGK